MSSFLITTNIDEIVAYAFEDREPLATRTAFKKILAEVVTIVIYHQLS